MEDERVAGPRLFRPRKPSVQGQRREEFVDRFRFFGIAALLMLGCSTEPQTDAAADSGEVAGADAGEAPAPGEGAFGVFAGFTSEYEPFATAMGFTQADYQSWAGGHFQALGAGWTRSNMQLIWDLVEPTKGGAFDWSASFGSDSAFSAAAAHGVQYLAVFHCGGDGSGGREGLRNPLEDLEGWKRFATAAVERYDGDGVDDAPGGISIKHWQIGNEIQDWSETNRTADDYARWVQAATQAIHAADSSAKIVLIASPGAHKMDPFYFEAIPALKARGVSFDVVDLHHWGTADLKSSTMGAVPELKATLATSGYSAAEIWSCEHGTYVGAPARPTPQCNPGCTPDKVCSVLGCIPKCASDASCPPAMPSCDTGTGSCGPPAQTQLDQARSLVYRYAVNRAQGVRRILWNNVVGWRCFNGSCGSLFDLMGLVADGWGPGETTADRGQPRLSYFSYQLLAARTEEAVAEFGQPLSLGDSTVHAYPYRVRATGKTALVAWADAPRQASLPWTTSEAKLTSLVTDASGTPLREQTLAPAAGTLSVSLSEDPVWIE
ncbi:MAG: hypothetical protein HY901_05915 [Deltaproteobacteria bacterium]|nr:hypothetical protein [Deltaproteobacteria bacterium]